MVQSTKKYFLAILLFLLLTTPIWVSAAGLVACGGSNQNPCGIQDFFYLVARVTNWLIMVAGIYAVFQMVFAGFNLVDSLGDEEKITNNKKLLSNAVVGFVLVMIAFILINTAVNSILLVGSSKKIDITKPLDFLLGK